MDAEMPLLSICIPSYNRGARVRALVDYLSSTVDTANGDIELIVSNNCSDDGTEFILSNVKCKYFKLVNRDVHLPTAEEHIFACSAICSGQFIWFLGDDDIPRIPVVMDALSRLRADDHDFYFYNSSLSDGYGGSLDAYVLNMNGAQISGSFDRIAPMLGFISSFAGLSNAICRRRYLQNEYWKDILRVSHIYSHVFWWHMSFSGTRMAVINQPIVIYRVDSSASIMPDYARVGKKLKVGDFYFWGEGLIRLFMLMETRGAMNPQFAGAIFETRRDGSSFRLMDNIVNRFFDQVALSVDSTLDHNAMPYSIFDECSRWILRVDPGYFDCMRIAKLAHDAARMPREDAEERLRWTAHDFKRLLQHKIDKSNRYSSLISQYRNYEIFAHPVCFVAVRRDHIDPQKLLRCLDPEDDGSDVLVASEQEELFLRIDQARQEYLRAVRP